MIDFSDINNKNVHIYFGVQDTLLE
jgi:hypothetical protein